MGKRTSATALVDIHRTSHVTQRGAAAILRFVKEHGLPTAVSESSQRRARQHASQVKTPFGPVVQSMELTLHDGSISTVHINHPFALIFRTLRECAPFRQLMTEKLERHPSSVVAPWGLIIYFDEISPTDPLVTRKDQRKIQSVYWTFREFSDIIFNETIWFCIACTRSATVADMEVGMSAFVRNILHDLFFNPRGHHFANSGITLDFSDPDVDASPKLVHLFASHWVTITDFKATKDVLVSMGQKGVVPCPICINIGGGADQLPLTDLSCNKWVLHTDASVRELQDFMGANKPTLGKTAFQRLETALGWHWSQQSILNDRELMYTAISTLMYDWSHVYCVQGLVGREFDAFMKFVQDTTPSGKPKIIRYSDLDAYMMQWIWPSRWQSCQIIFHQGKLSSTASELLSAAPVIRKYFSDVVMCEPSVAEYHAAAESMVFLCDAIELLQCAGRKTIGPQELHNGIMRHLRKHQAVYGDSAWVFKHHQAAHLAMMYKNFGYLYNTLVTERKHKEPKRFAMNKVSRLGYEKGLMEDMLLQHLHDWNAFRKVSLVNPKPLTKRVKQSVLDVFPGAQSIEISITYIAASGEKFSRGDLALLGPTHCRACGEIWYHFNVDGAVWCCLAMWPLLRVEAGRFGVYRICHDPVVIPSTDILGVGIYRICGDNATVIWPKDYKSALEP